MAPAISAPHSAWGPAISSSAESFIQQVHILATPVHWPTGGSLGGLSPTNTFHTHLQVLIASGHFCMCLYSFTPVIFVGLSVYLWG